MGNFRYRINIGKNEESLYLNNPYCNLNSNFMEIKDFVPAQEAANWIKRWGAEKPKFFANAFTIPIDDLRQAYKEEHFKTIRVYFGLTETGQMKLIVVGVDENKNDIMTTVDFVVTPYSNPEAPVKVAAVAVSEGKAGCYDVCKPCPPECGTSLLLL